MVKTQQHKIMFRVDASDKIGTGHVMRCLTLADALKNNGASTLFVSRHMPLYLQEILATKGHEFQIINSIQNEYSIDNLAHSEWLGVSQSRDALDTIKLLTNQTINWLVVDHYALDIRWESALRQTVKNILVIDDIADREHDCDVLLDQNFYVDIQNRYIDKVPKHCQLLLGPRYALLRPEFLIARQQAKVRSGAVKRILVFFGGIDVDNYTAMTLTALQSLDLNDIAVDVVIGEQNPNRDEVLSICKANDFVCHIQIQHMAELMLQADLSIGAGGSATWERCSLGLPTIAISTADNQTVQIKDAALSSLIYMIEANKNLSEVMERHLLTMIESSIFRQVLSTNAMEMVDGKGILRLIKKMSLSGIVIRKALEKDSEQIFSWRNHLTIRAVSRNSNLITWQEHQQWFSLVINDLNRPLLIGEFQDCPVGVVRFDIKKNQAEVSIYVAPEEQSSGHGAELLQSAENWLSQHYLEVNSIFAEVLGDNSRSHRLFVSANYQLDATSYIKRFH